MAADEALARSLAKSSDYGVQSFSAVLGQERLWAAASRRARKKDNKKKKESEQKEVVKAYNLEGLEARPVMTFLAHCVQAVVTGETVHEAGTRRKKFVTSATLEEFLRESKALAARGLCEVKEVGVSAARLKFVCLRAALVSLGETEAFMTRFDSYPASRQQRQPRATLLCTKAYPLTLVFRVETAKEWLPLTFDTVGCACGRPDCRFLEGREVASDDNVAVEARGMGEAFVLPGELPAKRRRGAQPPEPVTVRPKGQPPQGASNCGGGGDGKCTKGRRVMCRSAGLAFCLRHYRLRRAPRNNGRASRVRVSTSVTVTASHWDPFVAHAVHGLTVQALIAPPMMSAAHADIGEEACALCRDGEVSVARFDEFAQHWLCLTHFSSEFPNEDRADVSEEDEGSGMDYE